MTPQRLLWLLYEDPDLAAAIAAPQRELAARECVAPELVLNRSRRATWDESTIAGGIGLLVLEGLLLRRIGVSGTFGAELLGPGDVLRPWQEEGPDGILPQAVQWRVLQQSRLAVLDEPVTRRLARYPELVAELIGRLLVRSQNLSLNLAFVHQPRIERRLHMLLWHLAARWGRVRREGVVLQLPLTHAILADLVAARRPTVSSAFSALVRNGLVEVHSDHWLLVGGPPDERV